MLARLDLQGAQCLVQQTFAQSDRFFIVQGLEEVADVRARLAGGDDN